LPAWPLLGQISEIWLCFKLVGIKNFIWPYGFFWHHLKLIGLKNVFIYLALVWPFYAEKGAYEGKYCNSIFFGNTFANFL